MGLRGGVQCGLWGMSHVEISIDRERLIVSVNSSVDEYRYSQDIKKETRPIGMQNWGQDGRNGIGRRLDPPGIGIFFPSRGRRWSMVDGRLSRLCKRCRSHGSQLLVHCCTGWQRRVAEFSPVTGSWRHDVGGVKRTA